MLVGGGVLFNIYMCRWVVESCLIYIARWMSLVFKDLDRMDTGFCILDLGIDKMDGRWDNEPYGSTISSFSLSTHTPHIRRNLY